ncbi:MAG: NAD-binding protein, partial [Oscillospiraceae bacterium]
ALAAVTPDDNLNIVISQIAVEMYNVPRVVTRILDPAREGIFEELGLKTVCPTKLAAGALLNVILGDSNTEMVTFGSHTAKFNEKMEKRWIGRMICDIPIYENEIIYGIYNDDGNFTLANDPKRIVKETDKIIFSSLID